MTEQLQIKNIFVNGHFLSDMQGLSGTWATESILAETDVRLLRTYGLKYIDRDFPQSRSGIMTAVREYLNSIKYTLDGMYKSTQLSYNPITNYDMTETSTDRLNSTSGGSTTGKVTTYDSDTLRNTDRTDTEGSVENTATHALSRSGNIGVTTSQQMIQSERDVVQFDFVGYVCDKINDYIAEAQWREDRHDSDTI